jgi:hypothetical protein
MSHDELTIEVAISGGLAGVSVRMTASSKCGTVLDDLEKLGAAAARNFARHLYGQIDVGESVPVVQEKINPNNSRSDNEHRP